MSHSWYLKGTTKDRNGHVPGFPLCGSVKSQNVFYDLSALYSERRFQRPVRVLNAQWASEAPLLCLATASK